LKMPRRLEKSSPGPTVNAPTHPHAPITPRPPRAPIPCAGDWACFGPPAPTNLPRMGTPDLTTVNHPRKGVPRRNLRAPAQLPRPEYTRLHGSTRLRGLPNPAGPLQNPTGFPPCLQGRLAWPTLVRLGGWPRPGLAIPSLPPQRIRPLNNPPARQPLCPLKPDHQTHRACGPTHTVPRLPAGAPGAPFPVGVFPGPPPPSQFLPHIGRSPLR